MLNYFYLRNFFNVFVVGGGTGTISMFLAEQLRHENGEVVYLDFSKHSMGIAKQRAKIRKLKNMIFLSDWIESIPRLGISKVPFIQASGVLHHLKSPSIGMKILKDSLSDRGGIDLMLYGRSGRAPIYQMQTLLKFIGEQNDINRKLAKTKSVLNVIPKSSWPRKQYDSFDMLKDTDVYDLYLHSRDVCFSTLEVNNFVMNSGLYFADSVPIVKDAYYYAMFSHEITLPSRKPHTPRDSIQTKSIYEFVCSSVMKHEFYASKFLKAQADINDLDNVMYVRGNPIGLRKTIYNSETKEKFLNIWVSELNAASNTNANSRTFNSQKLAKYGVGFKRVKIPINVIGYKMLCYLMRSEKIMNNGLQIKVVYDYVLKNSKNVNISIDDVMSEFIPTYNVMKSLGVILLRATNVEPPLVSKLISYYMVK